MTTLDRSQVQADMQSCIGTFEWHSEQARAMAVPVTLSICEEPKWYAGTRSAPA